MNANIIYLFYLWKEKFIEWTDGYWNIPTWNKKQIVKKK